MNLFRMALIVRYSVYVRVNEVSLFDTATVHYRRITIDPFESVVSMKSILKWFWLLDCDRKEETIVLQFYKT